MNAEKKHPKVLVCTNRRFGIDSPSCAMRGSEKLLDAIKKELRKRNSLTKVEKFMCLGQCTKGPALRVAPGGAFYLQANQDDLIDICDWIEDEVEKLS